MSNNINVDTKDKISKEVKLLHEKCIDIYNIIDNSPLDTDISQVNIGEKALCYVEGLRTNIQNSNTRIVNDENLILSEFLSESKKRQTQIEELTAFTRGAILDIENEVQRLNNLTKTAQEALSRPKVVHDKIRSEHIQKAKSTFGMLKSELHGVIQSLFPNLSDLIMDIIAQLHQEKNNEETNGYIPITNDTFWIFELLRDMNIVSLNPYNKLEVKLAC